MVPNVRVSPLKKSRRSFKTSGKKGKLGKPTGRVLSKRTVGMMSNTIDLSLNRANAQMEISDCCDQYKTCTTKGLKFLEIQCVDKVGAPLDYVYKFNSAAEDAQKWELSEVNELMVGNLCIK